MLCIRVYWGVRLELVDPDVTSTSQVLNIGGFEFALDGMLNVRTSDVNDRKSAGKHRSLMYHTHLWERLPRARSEQPGR